MDIGLEPGNVDQPVTQPLNHHTASCSGTVVETLFDNTVLSLANKQH